MLMNHAFFFTDWGFQRRNTLSWTVTRCTCRGTTSWTTVAAGSGSAAAPLSQPAQGRRQSKYLAANFDIIFTVYFMWQSCQLPGRIATLHNCKNYGWQTN